MKLISQGHQHYVTEDGLYEILVDDTFESECEEPHPVRQRLDEFKARYANEKYAQQAIDKLALSNGAKIKARRTKGEGWVQYISWYCYGGEYHFYSQWTVCEVDGSYIGTRGVEAYDTFGEAVGALEQFLGEKITVVHQRKPKPEPKQPDPLHEVFEDELRGINEALDRYDELMHSDNAPFVDQKLHAFHLQRKAELEALLQIA